MRGPDHARAYLPQHLPHMGGQMSGINPISEESDLEANPEALEVL